MVVVVVLALAAMVAGIVVTMARPRRRGRLMRRRSGGHLAADLSPSAVVSRGISRRKARRTRAGRFAVGGTDGGAHDGFVVDRGWGACAPGGDAAGGACDL